MDLYELRTGVIGMLYTIIRELMEGSIRHKFSSFF
jgi:hypothetical protein